MDINEQQRLNENQKGQQSTENGQRQDLGFKVISPAGGEPQISYNVPKSQLSYKLACSVTDVVKLRAGELQFHCYTGVGFRIWVSIYNIVHPLLIIGKADLQIYEWHSFIKNCFKNTWDKVELPEPRCHQSNLSFAPWIDNKAEFQPGKYITCDFHFDPGFLEPYAKHFPILDEYLEAADKAKGKYGVSLTSDLNLLDDPLLDGIDKIIYCDMPEPLVAEYYENSVRNLLMEMLRTVSKTKETEGFKKTTFDSIINVREYIMQNLSKDLTIPALAKEFHISQPTLKRHFQRKFGMPIHQFVMQERLRHATHLLEDSTITIKTIAQEIGTKDSNYFYDFWKRFHPDITPEEWRKINCK
jgi:AraC-like DNA-binding protein